MKAPLPGNERARLEALRQYNILDTAPETAFDDITRLAANFCGTPTAIMSLIDSERQWFKSKIGEMASQTPREWAFCGYTILQTGVLEVEDACADERFADNPLVTGAPKIRFYAGAPLITLEGHALGSLCVIDQTPRQLNPVQRENLKLLARLVMNLMEARRAAAKLASAAASLKTLSGLLPICSGCKKIRTDDGYWKQVETYLQEHSEATFSHGLCGECSDKFLADLEKLAGA